MYDASICHLNFGQKYCLSFIDSHPNVDLFSDTFYKLVQSSGCLVLLVKHRHSLYSICESYFMLPDKLKTHK